MEETTSDAAFRKDLALNEVAPNKHPGSETSGLIQETLNANQKLQIILNEQAEKLDAELKGLDRLLTAASVYEAEEDPECEILIPGSKKPTGLFPSSEFLNESSPFFSEARKRTNYFTDITPRPMKDKDLEALADAVKKENARLKAYEDASMSSFISDIYNETIDLTESLDWTRIAERVSDTSSTTRSATECRITWIANKRPTVNHSAWSNKELDQLNRLVIDYQQQNKPVNWVEIAENLGTNRIPIDCMRHGITRPRHTWDPESDRALIQAVELYGHDNWHLVASRVSDHATPSQCQVRWTKSVDPAIKRGPWTNDEDDRLRKAVEGYGQSWIQVATTIPGRTNDQCRERWTEHLNVEDQNIWTEAEDKVLKDSVQELGNKWKEISKRLDGLKTGQACRARFDKLKRAENRQESRPVESISSVPLVVHSPIVGSFQTVLPSAPAVLNVTPSPSGFTSQQALQSIPPVRPRPTPRSTKSAVGMIERNIVTSEPIPISALPVTQIEPLPTVVSSLYRSSTSAQTFESPSQKKGRKRKKIDDGLSSTSSSDAPKRTRVTRSQTHAMKST
ncbi:hypothetical protein CPB83DRAFT_931095 [Crepidotus variabilis]|uniref:Uncharacterized protein n=1 Tax=Crepidotus variabilis TaxID=179855 RepID=A0A9P6JVC7_9AGAR|nr:hypothetical protein CPB83DRAFT_931095 [Crepidotus variabilis]